LLAVVVALAMTGCASLSRFAVGHGPAAPAAAHRRTSVFPGPQHLLSARVVLPSQTMTAGSRMTGHVLVDNNTGHAIHTSGCLNLFQVLLTSGTYRPAAAWALCLQRFTIPVGEARYPVTVWASYSQCSQGHAQHGMRACLPGDRMPPLPPGIYRVRLFQSSTLVRIPPPVTVRVIPGHE
jgi:hypothetical protein